MEQLTGESHEPEIELKKIVRPGSTVEIHYANDPEGVNERLLVIDNSNDSKPGTTLLVSSILGQAIIGKEVGATVEFVVRNKDTLSATITSIEDN